MLDNIKNSLLKSTGHSSLRSVLFHIFDWFYLNAFWGLLKKIDRKFVKFLFVGAINTLFGYFMYAIFASFAIKPSLALLISYFLGVFWNFKTTGTIVFKNKDNGLIFKFIFSYIFTYMVNSYFLNFLMIDMHVNKYLAQAILVLPIAMLSFAIFKTFVFVENK